MQTQTHTSVQSVVDSSAGIALHSHNHDAVAITSSMCFPKGAGTLAAELKTICPMCGDRVTSLRDHALRTHNIDMVTQTVLPPPTTRLNLIRLDAEEPLSSDQLLRKVSGNPTVCSACGGSFIVDKTVHMGFYIRRRKSCKDCDSRITTYELVIGDDNDN